MKFRPRQIIALVAAIVPLVAPTQTGGQIFQELYAFETFAADGDSPQGGLVQAKDGNLYGTTFYGGTWDFGTVFKITPGGLLTTLASFDGTTNDQHPITTMLETSGGNFYGATVAPSSIFKATPSGTLTLFGNPGGTVADGILQANDGYLYVVDKGNSYNDGFIYRARFESGTGELLFQFDYNHPQYGYYPSGGLIQATDGNFYGVTSGGGTYGSGTAFRMTPGGSLTTLVSFGPNGAYYPYGRLLQAADGSFYGVAGNGVGTIFRLTPDGTVTTVAWFDGSNGENPVGGLIQGNDGCFYGTARSWGTNSQCTCGTVFRMTLDGALTAIVSFSGGGGPFPGSTPYAGVVQGSDGNLYGTTAVQGSRGAGNVFRIIMPGPKLNSSRVGQQLVLAWRTNYSGFTLQSSSVLSSSNWTDCTNSLVVVGGQFFVTNSISEGARFFRLKK